MQYGTHIYIFTERWADDQLWVFDQAKALGLDVVEISVGDDVIFPPERTRDRAAALGLTITVGPGGAWPMECDLSSDDPAARDLGLAWRLTGKRVYLEKARRILNAYSELYPTLPIHDNNNKRDTKSGARVMSQTRTKPSVSAT